MTDWRKETVDTYNRSAKQLADYFRGIGSRVADIDRAFELAGVSMNPKILEIGCGDGRDAKEIVKRTAQYSGFDISEELIKLARLQVPGATFEVADAASYDYPDGLDIVFAFASLLHLDKNEVENILKQVHSHLNPGGIFYISLKYEPEYKKEVKTDEYGERLFYFYNPELITQLAGSEYEVIYTDRQTLQSNWFTIALRKL